MNDFILKGKKPQRMKHIYFTLFLLCQESWSSFNFSVIWPENNDCQECLKFYLCSSVGSVMTGLLIRGNECVSSGEETGEWGVLERRRAIRRISPEWLMRCKTSFSDDHFVSIPRTLLIISPVQIWHCWNEVTAENFKIFIQFHLPHIHLPRDNPSCT